MCGKGLAAERSTRRFCSTACRVKFHRDAGKRPQQQGLRPGQIRILGALVRARGGPLDRAMIAERAFVSPGWMSDFIGQADPLKRAAREARTGIVSLLTLGYVRELMLEGDGRALQRYYKITDSGRQALSGPAPQPAFAGPFDPATQAYLMAHAADPVGDLPEPADGDFTADPFR